MKDKTVLQAIFFILALATCFVSKGAAWVLGIWAAIDFLIYLVKDNPFNWLIFWLFAGSLTFHFLIMGLIALFGIKAEIEKAEAEKKIRSQYSKKSKYQERLEQAMAERNKSNLN